MLQHLASVGYWKLVRQEIITKGLRDSIFECIQYSMSMLGADKYTHTYKPKTVVVQWKSGYIYVVFVDM